MVPCQRVSGFDEPRSGMSAPLDSLVRFGAFELDLRTGELRKAGVRDQSARAASSGSQGAAGSSRRTRHPGGAEAATVVGGDIRRFRTRAECCGSPAARCARGRGRCAAVRRDAAPPRLPIHRSQWPVLPSWNSPQRLLQRSRIGAKRPRRHDLSARPTHDADSSARCSSQRAFSYQPLFSGGRVTCSGDWRLLRPLYRPRDSCWPCFPSRT